MSKGTRELSVDDLLQTGQLYRHDDHLHITHRFQNEDWEALYRLRGDESPLPPIRRQVAAAAVLATLVDLPIAVGSKDDARKQLDRTVAIIGKVRRGIEHGLSARQLDSVVEHNYELRDGHVLLRSKG